MVARRRSPTWGQTRGQDRSAVSKDRDLVLGRVEGRAGRPRLRALTAASAADADLFFCKAEITVTGTPTAPTPQLAGSEIQGALGAM